MKIEGRPLIRISRIQTKLKGPLKSLLGRDKRREMPGLHGKFDSLWTGPYIIYELAGANSFYLNNMDGEKLVLPMNGRLLNIFFYEAI